MLNPEDRAAWEDGLRAAQRPRLKHDEQAGWYVTASCVAGGFVALWALIA